MKTAFLAATLLCTLALQAQTDAGIRFDATVYALQDMAHNGSPLYMVNNTTDSQGTKLHNDQAPIGSHLTTLCIDASAIPGTISSISVYANNKAAIAGPLSYDGSKTSTPTGSKANAYASNGQSDVVMLQGDATTCTAYLLPANLTTGVLVTAHTTDGKYYSQKFSDPITAGSTQTLTLTNATANNLWMATIPGNTYFSFVSTPGAHDAATSGVTSYTTLAKCQDQDIASLLANGVRAFDLRPGYHYNAEITADNLYIYHGQVSTNVLYKDAIKTMVDFLKANPSEAISIVMIKENCKPILDFSGKWSDRSSEMWNVINACHSQYSSYMKLLDRNTYTLDSFRGKICYINRTGTNCTGTTRITNWPDDATLADYTAAIGSSCFASIQDCYNLNGTNKQNEIKSMLQIASSNTEKKNFHYNFCSSANSPASYAKATNPVISAYLNEGNIAGPTGYVYADYIGSASNGGADLLTSIVEQNYRYVYEGRRFEGDWDTLTGIQSATATAGRPVIYDLQGRPQTRLQRGMNIVNGTKIIGK